MTAPFEVDVNVDFDRDRATVTPVGELDISTAPSLIGAIDACGASTSRVTLDLRSLEFMDCSGVRSILEADRRVALTVIAGGGKVRQLLALTGADRRLRLAGAQLASRAA